MLSIMFVQALTAEAQSQSNDKSRAIRKLHKVRASRFDCVLNFEVFGGFCMM